MKLITIISCLLLVSCVSKPHPKMLSFTPASVVIDYTGNDLHAATSLAQQFCSSINKDAQYVNHKEEGGWTISLTAFFNCVDSSRHHNNHASGAPVNYGHANNGGYMNNHMNDNMGNGQAPIINHFR